MKDKVYEMLQEYAEGGLVSKNAMSDYFLASSGKMTEVEFVGKHKMSTLEFEKQFAEDNNVDISGTEKLSEVNTTPKGVKMDYSKKPKTMAKGGSVEIDPVSGNEIPPGSTPENVRDDIPAMLSEGEYVVPADVLKYFGVNFFEELRVKAKEGMLSMELDGRTGGEPMSAPQSQEEIPRMAEGGPVPSPAFNPASFGTPGASVFNTSNSPGSSMYEYKEYFGPNGGSLTIMFINGMPAQAIPEGYSETPPVAAAATPPTTPTRSNDGSDRQTTRGLQPSTSGGSNSGETLGGILGNPLDDLDFSDTASIDSWAADRLAKSTLQRGLGMAGLGGAAGSAAKELRDIAAVSAAARYYADMGDQESSDRLMGMANTAREDLGLLGRFSKTFSNGEDIFDNFKAQQTTGATAESSSRSGTAAQQVTSDVDRIFAQQQARTSNEDSGTGFSSRTQNGVDYKTATSDDGNTTVSRAVGSSAPTTSSRPRSRDDSSGSTNSNNSSSGGFTSIRDMFDGGGPGTSGDKYGRNKGGLVTKPKAKTTKK
jgi:hypothetical protein